MTSFYASPTFGAIFEGIQEILASVSRRLWGCCLETEATVRDFHSSGTVSSIALVLYEFR